jgi:hypothetical protein
VHVAEEGDEVLERPPEPVDAPRHDDVELASGRILEELVEGGALVTAPWPR